MNKIYEFVSKNLWWLWIITLLVVIMMIASTSALPTTYNSQTGKLDFFGLYPDIRNFSQLNESFVDTFLELDGSNANQNIDISNLYNFSAQSYGAKYVGFTPKISDGDFWMMRYIDDAYGGAFDNTGLLFDLTNSMMSMKVSGVPVFNVTTDGDIKAGHFNGKIISGTSSYISGASYSNEFVMNATEQGGAFKTQVSPTVSRTVMGYSGNNDRMIFGENSAYVDAIWFLTGSGSASKNRVEWKSAGAPILAITYNSNINVSNNISVFGVSKLNIANISSDLYVQGENVTQWFYNQSIPYDDFNYNQSIPYDDFNYNMTLSSDDRFLKLDGSNADQNIDISSNYNISAQTLVSKYVGLAPLLSNGDYWMMRFQDDVYGGALADTGFIFDFINNMMSMNYAGASLFNVTANTGKVNARGGANFNNNLKVTSGGINIGDSTSDAGLNLVFSGSTGDVRIVGDTANDEIDMNDDLKMFGDEKIKFRNDNNWIHSLATDSINIRANSRIDIASDIMIDEASNLLISNPASGDPVVGTAMPYRFEIADNVTTKTMNISSVLMINGRDGQVEIIAKDPVNPFRVTTNGTGADVLFRDLGAPIAIQLRSDQNAYYDYRNNSNTLIGRIQYSTGALNFIHYIKNAYHAWRTTDSNGVTAERMRLSADGNLSIGTTRHTQKLLVAGDANVTGTVYYGAVSPMSPNMVYEDSDVGYTRSCYKTPDGNWVLWWFDNNGDIQKELNNKVCKDKDTYLKTKDWNDYQPIIECIPQGQKYECWDNCYMKNEVIDVKGVSTLTGEKEEICEENCGMVDIKTCDETKSVEPIDLIYYCKDRDITMTCYDLSVYYGLPNGKCWNLEGNKLCTNGWIQQ